MSGFSRTLRAHNKQVSFLIGLFVAAAGLTGIAGVGMSRAAAVDTAKDCDTNAVIYCGFKDVSSFIADVNANNNQGTPAHHDLKAIYAKYGLEPADYDKFVKYARQGLVYRDGHITVDGQTVATNAFTLGRNAAVHGSSPGKVTIGGTTYYTSSTQTAFAANADSLPAEVLFDGNGVMQFAVLMSCGNPVVSATKVTPAKSCNSLQASPVSGQFDTYSFKTSASAAKGASVSGVTYDFGDGTASKKVSSLSSAVTHTYTTPGVYTAKVSVQVKLPGNQTVTVTSSTCQTVIPIVACAQLTGAILDRSKYEYSFTATAKPAAGATLTGADFNFGDGNKLSGVKPGSDGSTVTATHAYAQPATYDASAVLHFSINGTDMAVTAPACSANVTPTTPPTPECKPGVPVGSPACQPCQYDASQTADNCTPPSLPNTGAGNTIAIFAAVVIAGFMVYRQVIFRQHRAAFRAAEQGTSPLPLGDPLDSDAPLTGTPYAAPAHKRPTLRRRKRQF